MPLNLEFKESSLRKLFVGTLMSIQEFPFIHSKHSLVLGSHPVFCEPLSRYIPEGEVRAEGTVEAFRPGVQIGISAFDVEK